MNRSSSKRILRRLKGSFSSEKPTLWVGKNGLTPDLVEEALRQLEAREVVKVRLHQTVPQPTSEVAKALAKETGAEVVEARGRSFILYKARGGRGAEEKADQGEP